MDDESQFNGSFAYERHTFGVRGFENVHDSDESYVNISDDEGIDTEHAYDDDDDNTSDPQVVSDDDNDGSDRNSSNSAETVVENLSPEDKMEAGEGDNDLTDNEFLTLEEWREVIRNIEFGREESDDGEVADSAFPMSEL